MKKIVIDLDDVLALDGFLNMMNYFNNSNYSYEDIEGYYVEQILSKEKIKEFWQFFKENNVYDYAKVEPFAKEVLMNLMLEYEIYICSSYANEIENSIMPELIEKKIEFLMKEFPFITPKNFMFVNDKSLIQADYKVDDKIENLTGDGIKFLYTAYHNKDIVDNKLKENNIIRINNLKELENNLKEKVFTRK
jgi:5'(3')-deoxyribonucleotidase